MPGAPTSLPARRSGSWPRRGRGRLDLEREGVVRRAGDGGRRADGDLQPRPDVMAAGREGGRRGEREDEQRRGQDNRAASEHLPPSDAAGGCHARSVDLLPHARASHRSPPIAQPAPGRRSQAARLVAGDDHLIHDRAARRPCGSPGWGTSPTQLRKHVATGESSTSAAWLAAARTAPGRSGRPERLLPSGVGGFRGRPRSDACRTADAPSSSP